MLLDDDGDGFEQDRVFNLKNLKGFDSVRVFVVSVVRNCFGDAEHDDAPSTHDGGDEFC